MQKGIFYNDNNVSLLGIYKNYNIYTPNDRAPKYMNQNLIELKVDIHSGIIVVGDLNNPFPIWLKQLRRLDQHYKMTRLKRHL